MGLEPEIWNPSATRRERLFHHPGMSSFTFKIPDSRPAVAKQRVLFQIFQSPLCPANLGNRQTAANLARQTIRDFVVPGNCLDLPALRVAPK